MTNLETLFQTHFISDDTFGDLKILRSYDNGRLLEGTVQGEFVQFFFYNSCLFSTNKENCTHVYVVHKYINFKDHLVNLETESDFVHFGNSK